MYVRFFALIVILSCFAQVYATDSESPEELLTKGAKHYHAKEFTEAQLYLKRAQNIDPLNADLNYNLGLAEFGLGHYGSALAYWRRALDLSPWHTPSRDAIAFLNSQNKLRLTPAENSIFEKLHSSFLRFIPFHLFMVVCFLLFLLSFWQIVSYVGTLRKSKISGSPAQSFPLKTYVYTTLWLLLSLLTLAKLNDKKTIRATIISATAQLKTSPNEESASIIEIGEGQEVIVRKKIDGWLQVNFQGKTTGWINSTTAIFSSGDFL